MGVRRLFSRGGQKISRGGKNLLFDKKNNKKDTIYPKKSKNILTYIHTYIKTTKSPPCPPLRTPMGLSMSSWLGLAFAG